nr:beta-ketoacyl-[acyl-carrier-protein] synthase family protein [Desulfosediminicola flagellatus]
MSTPPLSPIAVTGCGCVSAAGINCAAAMQTIRSGLAQNTLLSDSFFTAPFAAPCFLVNEQATADNSILAGIEPEVVRRLNRTILLALTAIEEALSQAGIPLDKLREKRVGIALGTTVGCTFHNEEYYIDWKAGGEPDTAPLRNYFASNLAERIQSILGVQGPRVVITNACASGTDAIGLAKSWLEYGFCDIAIAGGADEISRIACRGFKSLMLVSEKSCQPFDTDRQGLNLGEGAGIMVLETVKQASAEQRNILGVIRGYGIGGDAHHPTAPHPQGRGLQQAVSLALSDAAAGIGDIAMINAHGTGTPANDKAETTAISEMGFDAGILPVVSTKGATGHTLGAAGGIEAVFTLLALNEGKLSGTVGCVHPDPTFAFPVLKQDQTAQLKGRTGISQSLAFGGSNSALVIEGSGK